MKILLVDDEKYVRADIILSILKSGFAFDWLVEAEDYDGALEMIERQKPDLVIADIVLDDRSGLELIREAALNIPGLMSIVISGYADFKYAQQSIDLGAIAYLLKPIKEAELQKALSKAQSRLVERRYNSANAGIFKNDVGLRDEFESFSHGIGDGSFDSLAALLPSVCKSFAVARIRLQLSRGDVEDYARLCERIAKFIVTPDFTAGFLYPIGNFDDFRQITVLCGDAWEPQRAKCDLRDRLVKLQRVLRREFNEGAVMGVSQLRAGLGAVMTTEAQHAQDLRLCLPNVQGIYFYGDYEGQPSNAPHSLYSVFTKVLDTEGPEEVEAFLRRILCGMAGKAALSLRLCCVDIFCALANYCLKAGGDTRRFLGGHLLNGGLISGFDTLSELTDKICAVVSDILRQYPRPGAAGDLLANVKNNIDEHFEDNDICTESLSRQFHVSLGYLSAAFSKKYGISISKYINAKRIDYAASLLLNTDMPICAIAEQCGYNNESYFRRVFSSHKNCSPAKYRDRGTSGGVKAET